MKRSRHVRPASKFERVPCYYCQATESVPFLTAQDDLTGKPGTFTFITCARCGLRYQNPRLGIEHVKAFYDQEYIAHRKKTNWGPLTGFFNWVMDRHDRQKEKLVLRYVALDPESEVLDVGCAVGTFLQKVRARYGARVVGVDFKDLRGSPSLEGVEFHCGLFYEQPLERERFDAITMWHFLEHDYDPVPHTSDRPRPAEVVGLSRDRGSPAGFAHLPALRKSVAGLAGAAAYRAL